jgi:hypothetical protein
MTVYAPRLHDRTDAGDAEDTLKAAGVARLFREKVSGVATRRPELEHVEAGDLLIVTKLDRLARSTLDPLRQRASAIDGPWRTSPGRSRRPRLQFAFSSSEFDVVL